MIEESLYISNNLIFIVFDKTVEHISVSLAYTCIEKKAILLYQNAFLNKFVSLNFTNMKNVLEKKKKNKKKKIQKFSGFQDYFSHFKSHQSSRSNVSKMLLHSLFLNLKPNFRINH